MKHDAENAIRSVLAGLQHDTKADLVLLGEVISTPVMRIRTLYCRLDQDWQPSFSYLLDTHPCRDVLAAREFRHFPDVSGAFPEGFLLSDNKCHAYAGFPFELDGESTGILVLLSRSALPAFDMLRAKLAEVALILQSGDAALPDAIERARLIEDARVRESFFDEYVLDNPAGISYSEFMPPVPVDLPEEQLLQRLIYTGFVVECNRAIARMYGYAEPAQMVGKRPVDGYGIERLRRNFTYWIRQNFDIRDMESQTVDAQGNITWIRGSLLCKVRDGKLPHMWIRRTDITAEKRYDAAVHHKAHHDALTALPNRYWFQDRITELIKDHAARGKRLCVGLLDLNGFKEVNDTLGHAVGDQILQAVAKRLLLGIRSHGAELARLGGDEFAILMPEIADDLHAEAMANALQDMLAEPFMVQDLQLSIGGSLGLSVFPDWSDTGEDILRLADVAMYAAKRAGQAFQWYHPEIDTHSKRRLSLFTSLGKAIESSEMFLAYQPKLDMRNGRVAGFEALIRWRHPTHGLIPPVDFIPFAETNEVIRPLTRWVLNEAIRQGGVWLQAARADSSDASASTSPRLSIAVNVSVRNLLDDGLETFILDCLQRHAFPAEMLELEVTESALMTHPAQAMLFLNRLRAHGISISIDDYGTGYSSLAYLARLPVTTLKVDQSFVKEMSHSQTDEQIVRSVIGLAHQCRLSVVAEGVEDEAALRALCNMECDLAQGYFIGRPMEADAVADWMEAYQNGAICAMLRGD